MQPTQHQRQLLTAGLPAVQTVDKHRPRRRRKAVGRVVRFLLHFAEMWIAMLVGMAVFDPVGLGLAAQGSTSLLDHMSIESEVELTVVMVASVVLWMRVRGWCWRDGAEMAVAMLVPWAAVLVLGHLGPSMAMPWLSTSEHTAMVLGMLAIMLYRRDHYTRGYSFIRWPGAAWR
jgi:predicted anti-sigma-YlaC factor YlaD